MEEGPGTKLSAEREKQPARSGGQPAQGVGENEVPARACGASKRPGEAGGFRGSGEVAKGLWGKERARRWHQKLRELEEQTRRSSREEACGGFLLGWLSARPLHASFPPPPPTGQQLPVSRRDEQPCCFHHAPDEPKGGKAPRKAWPGKRWLLRSLPNFSNFPSHPRQAPPVCPPRHKSRRRIPPHSSSGPEPPAGCKTRPRSALFGLVRILSQRGSLLQKLVLGLKVGKILLWRFWRL